MVDRVWTFGASSLAVFVSGLAATLAISAVPQPLHAQAAPALRFDTPSNPVSAAPAAPVRPRYTRIDPDHVAAPPRATGTVPAATAGPAAPGRPEVRPAVTGTGAAAVSPSRPATASPAPVSSAPDAPSAPTATPLAAAPPVSPVRPLDVAPWQKIGAPYTVSGTMFIPSHEPDYDETGVASWYGEDFHGRATANGEIFDMGVATAAHPTLPIPSLVEVTNLDNGRSIVVRVNDRGPFAGGRLIDLSARAAELLGYRSEGTARVRVRYVGPADPTPLVTAGTLTPLPGSRPRRQILAGTAAPTERPAASPGRTPAGALRTPASAVPAPAAAPASASRASPEAQGTGRSGDTGTAGGRGADSQGRSGPLVQVGAFASRANAERALSAARELGQPRLVMPSTDNGGLFRVVLGPFPDRQAAEATAARATSLGLGGRVVAVTASAPSTAAAAHPTAR
jgi:rare lipoprotein A